MCSLKDLKKLAVRNASFKFSHFNPDQEIKKGLFLLNGMLSNKDQKTRFVSPLVEFGIFGFALGSLVLPLSLYLGYIFVIDS